jgi:hypothetical protein
MVFVLGIGPARNEHGSARICFRSKKRGENDMEYLWAFVVIGGPILLGLAILYGTIQYRKRDRRLDPTSQEATRRLRKDLHKEDLRRH